MKIKPMKSTSESGIEEVRFNENTTGVCANIKQGDHSQEKRDYSSIVLISIMHEKNILKNELLKESFEEATKIINSYEGNKVS